MEEAATNSASSITRARPKTENAWCSWRKKDLTRDRDSYREETGSHFVGGVHVFVLVDAIKEFVESFSKV
jgi:hypothetical protein